MTVERSLQELEELQKRMIADRELAREGALSFPGVPGASYDLDIDVKRNAVLVFVEQPTQAAVDAFRERYGEAVIIEAGLTQPE